MKRTIRGLSAFMASVLVFCGVSLQNGNSLDRVYAEQAVPAVSVRVSGKGLSTVSVSDSRASAQKTEESRKETSSSAVLPTSPKREQVLPNSPDDDLPVTGARAGLTSIAAVLLAAAVIVARKDDDK